MHSQTIRGHAVRFSSLVLLYASGSAGALHAQASDPASSIPVTVGVQPGNSLPGGRIRVSGSTVRLSAADGINSGNMVVRVTITPVGRILVDPESTEYEEPRTFSVPINTAGGFSAVVDGPRGQGVYRVIAIAPDGKGTDSTTFYVVDQDELEFEAEKNVKKIVELATKAVENADQMIEGLPASPAKAEMQKKLVAIKAKMAEGPSQVAAFASGLDLIRAIPEKYPETTPAFAGVYRQMGLWTAQSRGEIETVSRELDKSRKARVTCDQLDRVIESFKFAALLMNLIGSPVDVLRAFVGDITSEVIVKEASASPRLSSDLGFQTLVGQVNKKGPDIFGRMQEWIGGQKRFDLQGSVSSLILDAASYAGSRVFESYCEKFEGPLKATMRAEFSKNGITWWKYSTAIEGKLVLRYAKGATGAAASISGQFEGSARQFTVWENAGTVLFPELMPKGALVARVIRPPIGSPYIQTEGMIAAQIVTPSSFYIPVEGTIVGKKLTLRLLTATVDFTTATARGVYVFIGPGTLNIPLTTTFTLPYKDARWILKSALGGEQTEFELKTAGKKMTIERAATVEKPATGANATYVVDLQACNPGC